jgi:hypothetical protein
MSDTTRSTPDVRFVPVGMGHHIAFLCSKCGQKKSALGRKRVFHRGIRDWLCAACINPKDIK